MIKSNILFITHFAEINGSLRSLTDLTAGLMVYGIRPHFAVPSIGSLSEYLTDIGYPFRILSLPWWVSERPLSFWQKVGGLNEIFCSAVQLSSLIREWNIDLVYTNTSVTPVGRLTASLEDIPHIWHIRELGDLHFSYHYLIPKEISLRIIRSSAAVICHAKAVQSHYFPGRSRNIHRVYNGCATRPRYDELLEQRVTTSPHPVFTFSMLSSISVRKGQAQAIRALAALHSKGVDARLILAGGGKQGYIASLKAQANELGVQDRVEFTGLVPDTYPIYFDSDCVLICSEYEAFSRAGLEAMSTALPVIARNSGGSPELVENGSTGILYDTEDDLVSAMTWMVNNPDKANQMGLAGWKRAKEHFSIEDCAANVYKIIQSVTRE